MFVDIFTLIIYKIVKIKLNHKLCEQSYVQTFYLSGLIKELRMLVQAGYIGYIVLLPQEGT